MDSESNASNNIPLSQTARLSLIYKTFMDSLKKEDIDAARRTRKYKPKKMFSEDNVKSRGRPKKRPEDSENDVKRRGRPKNNAEANKDDNATPVKVSKKVASNTKMAKRSGNSTDNVTQDLPQSVSSTKQVNNKGAGGLLVKFAKPKTTPSAKAAPASSSASSPRARKRRQSYSPTEASASEQRATAGASKVGIKKRKRRSPTKQKKAESESQVGGGGGGEIDDEICYLCNDYNCPSGNPDEEDEWVQCTKCPRWYHVFCICGESVDTFDTFNPDAFCCRYCA